jgi:hypothetical protein
MLPRIINLTLLLVIKEIEDILEDYPEDSYQVAFSIPELRQKLILHVVNQLPSYYAILEEDQELPSNPKSLYSSLEEKVCMEILIRESIVQLFRENADSISCHMGQK